MSTISSAHAFGDTHRSAMIRSSTIQLPLEYSQPRGRRTPKWRWALAAAPSIYPIAFVVGLYLTWIGARVELGHWPVPSLDDPKSIGGVVTPLYVGTSILMMEAVISLCVSLALL